LTSFSKLKDIVPNTSNPPFQVKWGTNNVGKEKSRLNQILFLLRYYSKSLTGEGKAKIERFILNNEQ